MKSLLFQRLPYISPELTYLKFVYLTNVANKGFLVQVYGFFGYTNSLFIGFYATNNMF